MISFGIYVKHHIIDQDRRYITTVYRIAYSTIHVSSVETIEEHISENKRIRTKLGLRTDYRIFLDESRNHYINSSNRLVDIITDKEMTNKCTTPNSTKTVCVHLYLVPDNEIYILQKET